MNWGGGGGGRIYVIFRLNCIYGKKKHRFSDLMNTLQRKNKDKIREKSQFYFSILLGESVSHTFFKKYSLNMNRKNETIEN